MATPDDLALWSLHCFCLKARATPHRIVRMDGNGRLLLAARNGIATRALEPDFPALQSRLELLAAHGLITRHRDIVTTAFPILGPDAIAHLRAAARNIVAGVRQSTARAASEIVAALSARGQQASAHAIVFGHALDGLLWDRLRACDMLPSTELSIEHPYWNGAFWALYPGRDDAGGTNELREGDASLVMVWTDTVSDALARFAAQPELRLLLRALDRHTPALHLGSLGLPGATIPVLATHSADPLSAASDALADAVATAIPTAATCQAILTEAGATIDAPQAVVILVHELIWEIAANLGIRPPTPGSIAPRMFIRIG